jgi:hypothetical protein
MKAPSARRVLKPSGALKVQSALDRLMLPMP